MFNFQKIFVSMIGLWSACLLLAQSTELIRCRVCFGRVSMNAAHCIHCGEPNFKTSLRTIEKDALQDREGIFFAINDDQPYSGFVVDGRYASGHPKIQQEYRNGKKWGLRKKWYENGQLTQMSYFEDGVAHGIMREWHENGVTMAEGSFEQGKLHGVVRRWYSTGKREAEYPYTNGELNGLVLQWSRKGFMIGRMQYENGKMTARLAVDPPPKGEEESTEETTAPEKKPPINTNVFDGLQLGFPTNL
jgi:hypothetical protein